MTNLYFVRHAHSNYTPDESGRPLSEKGLEDARKVTELLQSEKVEKVVSSPYKRAVQTVQGIAAQKNMKVEIVEGLKERTLSSETVEDFSAAMTKVWTNPTFAWAGGESNDIAQKRGVESVSRILRDYEGKNIVIGSHGNMMVLIMNHFDMQYDFTFWHKLDMPDIYKLSFDGNKLMVCQRVWQR
jgi:2,3-bisphosphoglycerate-dependent phosphoglycerate mutase